MGDIIFATNGNDTTGVGTVGNPYKTPRKCVSVASPGDFVRGRGGDHLCHATNSSAPGWLDNGGSEGSPITITNYDGEPVRLYNDTGFVRMMDVQNDNHYISWENLTFDGTLVSNDCLAFSDDMLGPVVDQCIFKNGLNMGIQSSRCISGTIKRSRFEQFREYGIYITTMNTLFEDLDFIWCSNNGIDPHWNALNSPHDNTGNIFRRLYFEQCGHNHLGGGAGSACIVWDANNYNQTFENIVIWKCRRGVYFGSGARDSTIRFLTVYGCTLEGILINSGSTNLVFQNALIIGNGTNIINNEGTTTFDHIISTGVAANHFVDAEAGDLHLIGTSPAVEAGLYIPTVTTDFDRQARGNPPDIGAFEFGSATAPVNVIPASRVTQVNIPFSFTSFDISQGGDLQRVVIFPESGTIA